jgi:Gas vesicle synthesis protein GvpL/GvpF
MAVYVYGIMRARDARAAKAADTDVVEHGELGALVGRLADDQPRLRRETIMSHANVLQSACEHGPVLPMRLGTALPDADTVVRELLAPQADMLAQRLDTLEGTVEMQVKAIYAEEPLLRSILDVDPRLKRAVERSRGLPAAATHFEQIRIGEAIAGAIEARQTRDSAALLSALRPLALAVSVSAPHHERAVINAAFLVDAETLPEFDAAVEQLSNERSPEIEFKLIGPLPAYSFADHDPQELAGARSPA